MNEQSVRRAAWACGAAAVLLWAGTAAVGQGAASQPVSQPNSQPASPAVSQPGAPGAAGGGPVKFPDEYAEEPAEHPYLTRSNARDWVVKARMVVLLDSRLERREATREGPRRPSREVVEGQGQDFDSVVFVWPYVIRSATAESRPASAVAQLRADGHEVPGGVSPRFLTGFHSGGSYASVEVPGVKDVLTLTMGIEVPVTCYDAEFDEAAAMKVEWPRAWPPVAQSTFQEQGFVEYGGVPDRQTERVPEEDTIGPLLERWLAGRDPKSMKPVELAKFLTQQVVKEVQPRGRGLRAREGGSGSPGVISGIEARGAKLAALTRKANPFDTASLLAAVYRRAGLPARVVIGYAVPQGEREPGEVLSAPTEADDRLYPWVEFCLYDESVPGGLITWVPVDVVQLRGAGSRTQKLDRPWRYFGTTDAMNDIIPLAYHYHPPTQVQAFDFPALFGVRTMPDAIRGADQVLEITAIREPKTASSVREQERRYGRPPAAKDAGGRRGRN